jgi:predicted transcriptional regulator of viral defense system
VLGKAVKKGRIKRLKNGVYQAVPPDDGDHGKVVSLRGR